jgi:hypothetical protein
VRRSVWGALVVTVLVAVLAGVASTRQVTSEVSTRRSKPPAEVNGAVAPAPVLVPGGAKQAPPAPPPERMLLVGDSVAFSIKDQLFLAAGAHGISMHNAAVSGCSVIGGVTLDPSDQPWPWAEGCAAGIAKFHSDLISMVQPQLVVWISSWESVDRRLADGTIVRFGTPDGNKRLMELIDEAAQRLTAGGARLVIVTLAPPPRENTDKHEATANLPILNELLREYAHEHPDNVFVAEMAEILCGEQICPSVVEGYTPRPDGVHFDDTAGGRWVSDQLIPMLLQPVIPADPRERGR